MSRATRRGTQSSVMYRLEDLEPAQVRAQRLRDGDRAIGVLVGLEDRHDRARDRAQRAVQRRDRAGALGEPAPDVEPPGLELGAVGRGGELAVAALRRDPGLAVELPAGREAEVAGRGVDDAVGELELVEELLLPRQQSLVLGVGLV